MSMEVQLRQSQGESEGKSEGEGEARQIMAR